MTKTLRPSMSKARRARLFEEQGGICWLCNKKVQTGEDYDLDHKIPWALGHDDSDANLAVAHASCHRGERSKTSDDVKRIAKAKRQSGIEGGQAARRAKRGFSLIKGKTTWPKGQKIPSRPFGWRKD